MADLELPVVEIFGVGIVSVPDLVSVKEVFGLHRREVDGIRPDSEIDAEFRAGVGDAADWFQVHARNIGRVEELEEGRFVVRVGDDPTGG